MQDCWQKSTAAGFIREEMIAAIESDTGKTCNLSLSVASDNKPSLKISCTENLVTVRKKDQNIYEKVSKKDKVDAIVVLDPHALEELGEQSDEDSYQGADIYGIGSSVKAVVLLDNGNIQGLVVPDAYEIGYKSVGEMAQRLEHRFYRLKGYKTEIKVFDRDEFSLNDNLERFLYSYE